MTAKREAKLRVFLKKYPDGTLRRLWYGRYMKDGRSVETSLCAWAGKPPKDGEEEGDAAFERSREKAMGLFREAMEGGRAEGEELQLAQKVHSLRYGGKVGRLKIADLAAKWDALPHKADLSEYRRERVHLVLGRFVAFMAANFPSVTDCGALTAAHFKGFLDSVDESGVSARSWNDHLAILRGVLAKVDGQSKGFREYLAQLPKRTETTVHRRPFTGAELEAIFAAAAEVDPELRPVIVAAACTALRRGDVARLRWDALDMEEGFASVKTTKTGETVDIPIFPPFAAVLADAERFRRPGVPYVFPRVAAAYKESPYSLDRRLRRVLAAAGFVTPGKIDAGEYPAPASRGEAVEKVNAGMRQEGWSDARRQKGLAILQRHLQGETGRAIAAAMGIARGAVSTYLHEMESAGKIALVSPAAADVPRKSTLAELRDGEQRKQRGSLCGWHSFRTTFCTIALENGVPMEILRKITGHHTADIVLKHYDRRGREAMKKAIGTAMPKAIAGTSVPLAGRVAEEFEAVPADVAAVARMLAAADAATLAKVKKILQKGGSK